MPVFRRRELYEARQLTKDNQLDILNWVGPSVLKRMKEGDWAIQASDIYFIVLSEDAFKLMYERVEM